MRDLDLLVHAAEKAGDIATGYFRSKNEVWYKPGDAGPVSEADFAVDSILKGVLTQARPDYGWLSEETDDDQARLDKDKVFIVDPIDGTRSFIDGSSTWAHSLAIAEYGRITAAVVYLPVREKIYSAAHSAGAKLNGQNIEASPSNELTGATILAARPMMQSKYWPGGVPDIQRKYRPSIAYRLCLVAEGRFDAMLTLRKSWEWDIAAGALILDEAGAQVSDQLGKKLQFNNPHPQTNGVVASGNGIYSELLAHLNKGAGR